MKDTVLFEIEAPAGELDRLVGELYSLGTLGVEEGETRLRAYFASGDAGPGVQALADPARAIHVQGPVAVPAQDWARSWREGLEARRVGPLWIRPSFRASQGTPELVIDPEQAFGSGEHATTRLALELLLAALRPGDRVLDVGTGSGILALGALRLGAASAVGFDLDALSCHAARANAGHNGLELEVFCGTADALAAREAFDVSVANMLVGELEPCLADVARRTRRALVASGYLRAEAPRVAKLLEPVGFALAEEREEVQGGDAWTASVWSRLPHARARQ